MDSYPPLPPDTLPLILAQIVHFALDDFWNPDFDGTIPLDVKWNIAYTCACFLAQHTVRGEEGVDTESAFAGLKTDEFVSFPERLAMAIALVAEWGGQKPVESPPTPIREWSGRPDPSDPDNFWIDDKTGAPVGVEELSRSVAQWVIAALGDLTEDYLAMTAEDVERALLANKEHAPPSVPYTLKVRDAIHGTLDVSKVFPGDIVAEERAFGSITGSEPGAAIIQLKEAHDALFEVLEDEDAGNDAVRDAAIDMCDALNAFWETHK